MTTLDTYTITTRPVRFDEIGSYSPSGTPITYSNTAAIVNVEHDGKVLFEELSNSPFSRYTTSEKRARRRGEQFALKHAARQVYVEQNTRTEVFTP